MSRSALELRFLIACLPSKEVAGFLRSLQLRAVTLEEKDGLRETVMDSSTPGHAVVMAWVKSTPAILEWVRAHPRVRSCAPRTVPAR